MSRFMAQLDPILPFFHSVFGHPPSVYGICKTNVHFHPFGSAAASAADVTILGGRKSRQSISCVPGPYYERVVWISVVSINISGG